MCPEEQGLSSGSPVPLEILCICLLEASLCSLGGGAAAAGSLALPDDQSFHEEVELVLFRAHFRQRLAQRGDGKKAAMS